VGWKRSHSDPQLCYSSRACGVGRLPEESGGPGSATHQTPLPLDPSLQLTAPPHTHSMSLSSGHLGSAGTPTRTLRSSCTSPLPDLGHRPQEPTYKLLQTRSGAGGRWRRPSTGNGEHTHTHVRPTPWATANRARVGSPGLGRGCPAPGPGSSRSPSPHRVPRPSAVGTARGPRGGSCRASGRAHSGPPRYLEGSGLGCR
jgi:hypothetical protein